jgi:structural maintenance of chromosome 3 (chondroitin sulfate proteoglycan 6)
LQGCNEEYDKAYRSLMGTMDRNTAKGLKSVADIVSRYNINGYHGPIYELFDVPEHYQTAVEVVAGSSLFHIVVDNDDIASRILDILNKEKGGRVTFMPLNRLKPKEQSYPDSVDVTPMIQQLKYEQKFHPAFLQIFGKAIITRTLETASTFARSHNLTAVTMDGDRADRKGALTGGFHDTKRSRLDSVKALRDAKETKFNTDFELVKAKAEIHKLDQDILQIRDNMSVLDAKRRAVLGNREPLSDQVQSMSKEQSSLEGAVTRFQRLIDAAEIEIRTYQTQIEACKLELGTPFRKRLTDAEQARLESLGLETVQLKSRLAELVKERTKIEASKNLLQIEIDSNLQRQKEQLQGKLEAIQETDNTAATSSHEEELQTITAKIEADNERFEGCIT